MHILRKVAAILTGVAALIGGASIAAGANAADSTITGTALTNSEPLEVDAPSDTNLTGSDFEAVPLAYYSSATTDGTYITSYDLKDAGLAGAVKDALDHSGITPAPAEDASNPMVWVAKNLYQPDSTDYPWSGKLRDFLDRLKSERDFKDVINGASTAKVKATKLDQITGNVAKGNVKPGIYAIYDNTKSPADAAIIAMTGTGIDGKEMLNNNKVTKFALGKVEYKANPMQGQTTTVLKGIKAVDKHGQIYYNSQNRPFSADVAIGSTVTYQITSPVPNWTGYDDFRYQIVDTTDNKALTFNPDSVKVTVEGITDPLTEGTDYTVSQGTTSDGKGDVVTFKFGDTNGNIVADKAKFPEGKTVTVTYTATVNKNAVSGNNLTNWAEVQYSHNPNNPGDFHTAGRSEVYVITGHVNVFKTDMNKNPLPGAKFDLLDENGNAVNVVATNASTGQYRLADADETKAKDATNQVVTASDGTISIDGLNGKYELKEIYSPLGSPVLADTTFTVQDSTVENDTTSSDKYATVKEANNLASLDPNNADQIDVFNARNLLEMPKTGAAGILMNVIIALLLVAAGVTALLVHRHNVKKAASAK